MRKKVRKCFKNDPVFRWSSLGFFAFFSKIALEIFATERGLYECCFLGSFCLEGKCFLSIWDEILMKSLARRSPKCITLKKTRRIYFNAVFSFFFYFIATAELHNKQIFRVYFISWSNMMIGPLLNFLIFCQVFWAKRTKWAISSFPPFQRFSEYFPREWQIGYEMNISSGKWVL